MKAKIFIATALFIATAFTASAQNARSLKDENRRIRQGVKSGQLTAAETARLKAEESRLRAEAIRDKTNNGNIGPAERAKLLRDEKRLDRNIRRQKHDRQRRH
ncbi:MAG: hypothetical protein ABJA78_00525 [Ferruginibacter sp.]